MGTEDSVIGNLITVVYISNGDNELDKVTTGSLSAQTMTEKVGYVLFAPEPTEALRVFADAHNAVILTSSGSKASDYNRAAEYVSPIGFATFVESGDKFAPDYLELMSESMEVKHPSVSKYYLLGMPTKVSGLNGEKDIFSSRKEEPQRREINLEKMFSTIPTFMRGTWIRGDYYVNHRFSEDLVYEYEREYLYNAAVKEPLMLFDSRTEYTFNGITENDFRLCPDVYERDYYFERLDEIEKIASDMKTKYGRVPTVIQYQIDYALSARMDANLNNRNKHIIAEEDAIGYITSWSRLLQYLDDDIILNFFNMGFAVTDVMLQRMLLRIKYNDPELNFDYYDFDKKMYYGKGKNISNPLSKHSVDIIYMECKEGNLHIDAVCADLYDLDAGDFECVVGEDVFDIRYTERYAHTKIFGVAVYKKRPFEVDVVLEDKVEQRIKFRYTRDNKSVFIPITFGSHFSRLSKRFKNCYWCFKSYDLRYMAIFNANSILVKRAGRLAIFRKEHRLRREMFRKSFRDKKAFIFLLIRQAYFFCRPFMKKRPIWLFFDKIYKGGDSSEYIYKYACAQDDNIDKYYLIDKKATDYKRLKKEGYKPLKRGSIKHRLIFLYSDMIIASNSTLMEFNDYSMATSSYVRDLINYDAVCVQHGMSIQKIAIAQNRLRDNIKLYFCASPYEIENLNRPVYDYEGRDILKLTGVPRYDGLKDRHKKQIMISPTWRMQAALAPKGNEGVERDYNPLFKETDYFKIYNGLINDKRLIEAAEKYGYKLLYVLHPIVSPQLQDFDKNEHVTIVPSVGDFSYEDAFCESALMVTDYSGIQFDFAYMRKPVLYLHHKDMPTHYEEGTYHYDTMAFGEICHDNDELIDQLIDYMKNDCKMKEEYVRRVDDFFKYNDNNNCSRIYPIMYRYTMKHYQKPEKSLFASIPSEIGRMRVEGTLMEHAFRTNRPKYKHEKFKAFIDKWDDSIARRARKHRYKHVKVKKNKIFFMTYDSTYICNPRYIADEIIRRGLDVELVWGVPHVGRLKRDMYPEELWLARRATDEMFRDMASSRIWIDNALEFMIYGIPKKKGQIYMNTWHGSMGIKKLSGDDVWLKRAARCNKETDYCITNSTFEENVFRETFWQDTPFLKFGHARNDVFFDKEEQDRLRQKLYEYYDLKEGTKVFLYAPTFREVGMAGYEDVDYEKLKKALDDKFGGNWVILVRWHHKERKLRKVPKGKTWLLDASEYGDMQELLPAVDAGMSDYSSWVYDYILTGRPVFLYVPDIANYDQARGFYYPLESTPFPLAKDNSELVSAVGAFDTGEYDRKVKAFLEDKGCYETGDAAKKIVDKIEELIRE